MLHTTPETSNTFCLGFKGFIFGAVGGGALYSGERYIFSGFLDATDISPPPKRNESPIQQKSPDQTPNSGCKVGHIRFFTLK